MLSESGTILYLKSIMESAKSIKKLMAMKKEGSDTPDFNAIMKNIRAEVSSMRGYCIEILLLQNEHLPLKNIHEKRGMLCQGFSLLLQL